jgi:CDP-paratose 2-epimerase
MGKVDQGVFSYWMLAHHFRRPLRYIGFGGRGKQVRDLLHVEDLIELLDQQLSDPERWDGVTANVGGGRGCSLSLLETTALCAEITGNTIEVASESAARPGDVPAYVSDCSRLFSLSDWRPQRGARQILADIHAWICEHEEGLNRTL